MDSPGWSVRWGSVSDAGIALDIARSASRSSASSLWSQTMAPSLELFRALARAHELVLGCEGDYAEACMILCSRPERFWQNDGTGNSLYVQYLAVRPKAFGKNWPSRLLTWARVCALRTGMEYLKATAILRECVIQLFMDEGFELVDLFRDVAENYLALRLQMPLRQPPLE